MAKTEITVPQYAYATMIGHTDRQAHEVVKYVSNGTIEIRRLNAKLLNGAGTKEPDALVFQPGGFVGHTSGTQRYEFSQNAEARVFRIRKHINGHWKDAHGNRYVLRNEPEEFYDFNF